MGNMTRSDSPISRRIVLSFLDFLNSVQLAPGADTEALEVARDCLVSVFNLNSSCTGTSEGIRPGLLLELFSSLEASEQDKLRQDLASPSVQNKPSSSTIASQIRDDSNRCTTSNSEGLAEEYFDIGSSGDELFAKFYAVLDEVGFFKTTSAGVEDPAQLANATQFFDDALLEVQKSGRKSISLGDLAEFFKSKGNELMQSKEPTKAVELYTWAIALRKKNAVYYCNRAAAYTVLKRYNEAIEDCLKSTEIDPGYSKAYSRLGAAYFSLGNYGDALKGYLQASRLDPSNETVRQNIEVTKQKLAEQQLPPGRQDARTGQESNGEPTGPTNNGAPFTSYPAGSSASPDFIANIIRGMTSGLGQQSSGHSISIDLNDILGSANLNRGQGSTQTGSSNDHTPPFTSFPNNASVPPAFANMFANMASHTEGNQAQERSSGNQGEHGQPDVHMDVHVDIGGQEQVTDALRSMMQMFSSQMGPQEGTPRGSGHT